MYLFLLFSHLGMAATAFLLYGLRDFSKKGSVAAPCLLYPNATADYSRVVFHLRLPLSPVQVAAATA